MLQNQIAYLFIAEPTLKFLCSNMMLHSYAPRHYLSVLLADELSWLHTRSKFQAHLQSGRLGLHVDRAAQLIVSNANPAGVMLTTLPYVMGDIRSRGVRSAIQTPKNKIVNKPADLVTLCTH